MPSSPLYRTLSPGQRSDIYIHDVESGENRLVFATDAMLLEAPNWTLDGESLILNGHGTLWRLPLATPALHAIEIPGLMPLNNDHVLDPDGRHIFLSTSGDWQIWRAPLTGGKAVPVTRDRGDGLMHFLHGVSPDGAELAFVGLKLKPGTEGFQVASTEIHLIAADGSNHRAITAGGVPVDGPEYSPDGAWIYLNTELFSGHAQIARMRRDGSGLERLTISDTVDWFPHLSADGRRAVYLSYPPGTRGHPADLWVTLMLVDDGRWDQARPVARLFGGQGTINVHSWAPDGSAFAYVAYPV